MNVQEAPSDHPYPIEIMELVVGRELIDQYNHVNYKKYPRFLEPAQDDYMEKRGIGFPDIEMEYGLLSVVRSINIEYFRDLREGDEVRVTTQVIDIEEGGFTFEQIITRGEDATTNFQMRIRFVDRIKKKPAPIPEKLRKDLVKEIHPESHS